MDITERQQLILTEYSRRKETPIEPKGQKLSGPCPGCGSFELYRQGPAHPFAGPYSGGVTCCKCGYRDSFMSYLGKQLFRVEPLPQGALPVYDKMQDAQI